MEWISVHDRLPENTNENESEDILIYSKKDDEITIAYLYKDWFYCVDSSLKREGVTHWQPLPNHPD